MECFLCRCSGGARVGHGCKVGLGMLSRKKRGAQHPANGIVFH